MQNIQVHRYGDALREHWQGFIEPDDLSWIMFVAADGTPMVFLNRNPETGAVMQDIPDASVQPCATEQRFEL